MVRPSRILLGLLTSLALGCSGGSGDDTGDGADAGGAAQTPDAGVRPEDDSGPETKTNCASDEGNTSFDDAFFHVDHADAQGRMLGTLGIGDEDWFAHSLTDDFGPDASFLLEFQYFNVPSGSTADVELTLIVECQNGEAIELDCDGAGVDGGESFVQVEGRQACIRDSVGTSESMFDVWTPGPTWNCPGLDDSINYWMRLQRFDVTPVCLEYALHLE